MSNQDAVSKLSPGGAAFGLSAALVVLFVLCAIVELIAPGIDASHAWIGLFTTAPVQSLQAWISGIVFSIVFGVIAGAIFALAYNAAVARTARP